MPDSASHILLLQASAKFGGSRRSLLSLIDILRDAHFSPVVACSGPGWVTEQLEMMGVPFVILPFYAWRKWLERFRVAPSIRKRWVNILSGWNFRLVHSNEFWWAPHAILAGKYLGIPAVVHLRDGHHTLKKARQYRLEQASAVIAVSSELKAKFAADPGLFQRTHVIFNAHDESAVRFQGSRTEARRSFGIADDRVILGNAGRICERKNQRLLLQAAARLTHQKQLGPLNILFAGDADTDYLNALRDDIERLQLSGRVKFLGALPNLSAFYAAADLIVHCARREGLPRVIPEAMLARRPVIATAAEGVRDAIPDERFGVVVAAEDSAALAAEIFQLLKNPELREEIAERACRRAENLFSIAAHRENILHLYGQLLP